MSIPYRTRRALGRLGITLLILLVLAILVLVCWFLWLNRYIVYTREGVRLDFHSDQTFAGGQIALPPEPGPSVPVYFTDRSELPENQNTELTQLSGVYITEDMLKGDIAAISQKLQTLPAGSQVMIEVKNIAGKFFYNSGLGRLNEKIDQTALEEMIRALDKKGFYLIARFPAFRDYWRGYDHVDDGIFKPNRNSLWMDEKRCYWLNPQAEGTITYVAQIISELKALGFDEAVMADFAIPDTENIYFKGDRAEAIRNAADILVTTCATERFAVSFLSADPAFYMPEGRCRLYMEGIAAVDLPTTVGQVAVEDTAVELVFLTDLMDTRFDPYGVLRPFSAK